jgi:hypothetical protein
MLLDLAQICGIEDSLHFHELHEFMNQLIPEYATCNKAIFGYEGGAVHVVKSWP